MYTFMLAGKPYNMYRGRGSNSRVHGPARYETHGSARRTLIFRGKRFLDGDVFRIVACERFEIGNLIIHKI